ncbi:fimbrial biogenesis chaperone [Pseudomonas glycinae]|uniref:fimbrial biogenesis chaperone n=1 Tax=Pseudomonas glycinae TaxID=1785145 RepID=UPI001F16DFF5|nr:molecular chaperone [Pseudomonas glycinae]
MPGRSLLIFLGVVATLITPFASASISLSSTRVIFDGTKKEANITVRNGDQSILIQSWLDADNNNSDNLPFAVTPPLVRISSKQQQLLRIIYEGRGMPSDKESVMWLNVQEIPHTTSTEINTLQLAIRQRIKVFFRPEGLAGDAAKAPEQLYWSLRNSSEKQTLIVTNKSNYHVSLADLKLASGDLTEVVTDSTMIKPGETRSFPLKKTVIGSASRLTFLVINDYGAQQDFEAQLDKLENHAKRNKTPVKK